jgi:hypothetical protein
MACILEIKKTIEKSIDEQLPDRGAVMSREKASTISNFLNTLWTSAISRLTATPTPGLFQVTINSIEDAAKKELAKQQEAEAEFTRDLSFFNDTPVAPESGIFYQTNVTTPPDQAQVQYMLKAVDILQSDKAKQVFEKGRKNKWLLDKILTELAVPKDQQAIIQKIYLDILNNPTLVTEETDLREEIVMNLLSDYSYAIEINTAKEFLDFGNIHQNRYSDDNTSFYSNLTVPGGTNYTENEIATPAITPSIKGHAQFATDQGIGWFRSDEQNSLIDKQLEIEADIQLQKDIEEGFAEPGMRALSLNNGEGSKTRRILEVQSDLFQKGRDKKDLSVSNIRKNLTLKEQEEFGNLEVLDADDFGGRTEEQEKRFKELLNKASDTSSNQFLQLLNKDNNWVTFFVKSIVQDSAKKGYEKVLFPTGDTASKVEGHTTLEEFKKQKEDRLQKINNDLDSLTNEYGLPEGQKYFYSDAEYIVFKDGKLIEHKFNSSNYQYIDVEINKDRLEAIKNFSGNKALDRNALNKLTIPGALRAEKKQLEQELERVETEGFGALKPIYNFYKNTVTNILNKTYGENNVKQITDEYGNTWNEIVIDHTREGKNILLQKRDMSIPSSVASEETIERITAIAQAMGVKMTTLQEYAKGNPAVDTTDLNGLADLYQKVIAIAEGREDVALTEEVIHMATAILEETNPGVITEMISKIDRFKIYKTVFDEYKNLKNYQNANGTPNIRKIKKEAVDKLIVEVLINGIQGTEQNTELREEETISLVKKWWRTILDFLSGNYRKTNLDIFKSVADKILEGNIGSVENINTRGIYAQLANSNSSVEKLFNTIISTSKAMKLNTVEEGFDSRHYIYTDASGTVTRIKKSVTESIEKVFKEPRTGLNKISDDSKRLWGTRGHDYIMDYIRANLIDPITGFAKIPTDIPIATELDEDVAAVLRQFSNDLISRYKPGTRFIVEEMVTNKDKSLGSTIDFMAIEPYEKPDGTPSSKIDILDWKFTSIDEGIADDIPWYKQNDWKKQMNEYARIIVEYGANPADIRKARMVPFIMDYSPSSTLPKGNLYAGAVEVGDLDNLSEMKTYLLPVPIQTESTGNPEVDNLISALFVHYDKLKQRKVDNATQKFAKAERLKELSLAIRKLQVTLNFDPLVAVGHTFIKSAEATVKSLENIDYSSLSKEELQKTLGDLLSIQNSAQKFINLGDVLLSAYPEGLSEAQRKTLEALGIMSNKASLLDGKVDKLQKIYAMQLGVSTGFVKEADAHILLNPEKAVNYISKTFLEASKLSSNLIKLGSVLIQRAASLVDITFGRQMNKFNSILIPLEKLAQSKGINAFDMIGVMNDKGLYLTQKTDPKFIQDLKEAREAKNKDFIVNNINMNAYNAEVADILAKQEAILKEIVFDPNDERNNDQILSSRLARIRNNLNINRTTFNGWTDGGFIGLVNKHMKADEHLSKEYVEMAKTKEALDMWEYFTALNEKAIKLGYINKKESSFFPLIEGTILQKFSATKDFGKETMDFFKDLGTNRIDEVKSYSRIDPETHEVIRTIPTYFTKTDKTPQKLSKDLAKVGALYTKALLDYESRVNLENTLLTLYEVEVSKGGLNVDENGNIIKEGFGFQSNKKAPNAAILKAIIDDSIYGISETSEGVNLSADTKKKIEFTNTWIRALGVGLKPKLSIANYFGGNFQAFIMAGGVYRYREFVKNHTDITLNKLSLEKRGLMDLLSPLSESVVTEKLRKVTKEFSYKSYLNTWTFSDVMHSTNSYPDRLLQMSNALAFIENTMVVDGSLVNIREYVRAMDRKARPGMTIEQRLAQKETQQARIDELKKTRSIDKLVKVDDNGVTIPGVSDAELAKFRTRVLDYGRNLNGQMSDDNKAGYKRNIILRGFMMFRTWIPKLIHTRVQDITYNAEQDNWEYGRMRLWTKTLVHMGYSSIFRMNHIIQNTEEGMRIMDEMLEEKKAKYLQATGQELRITNEEFYELVQQELSREVKELRLLVGILGIVLAAKIAEPPEDAPLSEQNKYKFWYKTVSKISDELRFYYNPATFQEVTKGNIIPSLSLLAATLKFFDAFAKETYLRATGDEEAASKNYPGKYFFNIIPVGYQFQTEILPIIDPEAAKAWGIRVTKTDSRS